MTFRSAVLVCLSALVTFAAGCSPANGAAGTAPDSLAIERDAVADSLTASLQASVAGDEVVFTFQVTNTAGRPLELRFPSGQSYDFVVLDDGREVWRWSADRMFTQALRTETLAPGETLTHSATWTPPADASGERRVVATLASDTHPVRQEAVFRLP